jgi:hypothetical protein
MNFAGGNGHEVGKVSRMVEFDVKLHRALGGPELRPVEQRQTKIDRGSIHAVKRVFKPEFVLGGDGLAFRQHEKKDFFKKLMAPVLVGVGKRRPADRSNAQMVQPAGLAGEARFDSAKRVLSGQLSVEHRDKVVPGAKAPGVIFGFGLFHGLLKFVSRKHLQHLSQYRMMVVHRLTPLVFNGYA